MTGCEIRPCGPPESGAGWWSPRRSQATLTETGCRSGSPTSCCRRGSAVDPRPAALRGGRRAGAGSRRRARRRCGAGESRSLGPHRGPILPVLTLWLVGLSSYDLGCLLARVLGSVTQRATAEGGSAGGRRRRLRSGAESLDPAWRVIRPSGRWRVRLGLAGALGSARAGPDTRAARPAAPLPADAVRCRLGGAPAAARDGDLLADLRRRWPACQATDCPTRSSC